MKKIFLIISLFIIISCQNKPEDKLKLKLVYNQGDTYQMYASTDMNINQTLDNRDMNINQKMNFGYLYKVNNISENGVADIDVTYNYIKFYQNTNGMTTIDYDSEKNTEPIENLPLQVKPIASMLNKSFNIKIDEKGIVKDISGIDDLLNSMFDSMNMSNNPQFEQIKKTLKKNFGDETIKQSMQSMTDIYPDKPVVIGDEWTNSIKLQIAFPMMINNTWTLIERNNGIAKVKCVSEISTDKNNPGMDMGAFKLIYDCSGKQSGYININESNGWMISGELEQKIEGTVNMMPQNKQWPINITSVIKYGNSK